ncbi:polycystic kidney disease protein 1-like 2 [Limulus polyphemus]|uniref:Polycystic kidney disease protein 1-like 2 n=1 Tax=Limulus polyphemus TaxID=6850 RepID=A0ABM1RXH4_LIMPO|nr:polycystic kidney disease protein 1-like 2 [Limulus polyphemus]
MTVPRSLGRLNYMRIWHDNSGKGKFRSWFLSFIVIRDVQTGQKYEFIANKWFAVEKDDGAIDRLLPVAGKGEATEFSHLFNVTSRKNLSDGHLWFSIFMRPPKSRFTRCQRVSCCIALLYLSMLVNAMWYGRTSSKPSASAVSVGPLSLSPEQIGVGVMANLIVFPPTFLMITLFRKSKLRKLRPSRVTEALKKQSGRTDNEDSTSTGSVRPGTSTSTSTLISDTTKPRKDNDREDDTEKKKKKKKKFLFPWWCLYLAWFVSLSTIAVSVFFLWGYGVQFGDEKTRKWVTSLLISFFTSILVTQPIKVFLMAMIFSTLCKSVDNDEDDAEEDEEAPELNPDEEWLYAESPRRSERKLYKPINVQATQRAKEERLTEMKMNAVIREILSYLLFLWILIVLSYGNRDPNAFYMQVNLNNAFIKKGDSSLDFTQATTPLLFWRWVREAVVPELLVGKWYNGGQPLGLRGFLDDRVNRLMGYGVLRQVRTKNNTCNIVPVMKDISESCSGMTSIIDEDRKDYSPGWTEPPTGNSKDEYHYRSSSELDGLPFWGKLDVYSGGGYVFPLRGTRKQLKEMILKLETSDWVDSRTRAVFVEFSVYNAQVNLFGVVTIVAEFFPGGGIVPFYRIDPIRLMRYHEGFGLFVLLCEVFYVVFTLFFTVREIKNIRKERTAYFQSYWSIIELVIIGLSYTAIVFYVYRMVITHRILKIFTETNGNGYVKLQFVAAVDEIFGYISSFLIFIAILKFTRLLRFNRRMGFLYSTLSQCSKDLKSFCVVFLITYLAFVQVFYLIFGVSLIEFSSFVNSAETSFNMMRGKFDFESMYLTAPVVGPLIFFFFAFITSIILLNIFITLIISSFQSVKDDIDKQSNDFEIISFMKNKFKSMFGADGSEQNDQIDQPVPQSRDQIDRFPEKVDRLLYYINDMYFEGTLDLKNKSALKAIYKGSGENTAGIIRRNPHKPLPLIDWSELTDDQKVLDKL